MKRKSKREMVLDIYDREAMGEVTAREIAIINQGLIEEYGEGGVMDPGEIARVLVDEDIPIRYGQIFRMATQAEKYENLVKYLPRLGDLDRAATSIFELDELYRKFQRASDRIGVRCARQAALRGKQTAEQVAVDQTQSDQVRAAHGEIAQWLTVWLQTPDLFEQWLQIRQGTVEYRAKFSKTS